MKTLEHYHDLLERSPSAEDDIKILFDLYTDARDELLKQNAKMREILNVIPHRYKPIRGEIRCGYFGENKCLACKWNSLSKDLKP